MTINNNPNADVSRVSLNQTAGPNQTAASSRASGAASSEFATADSTPGDDSISLSGTGNLVQQALNSSSSDRAARIQQLRALVQNNQYLPDAQDVASAVVAAHIAGS